MRLLFALSLLAALACSGGPDTPTAEAPTATPAPVAPQPVVTEAPSAGRPLYYDRALTAADLDGRTLRELALMRNTIFARQGHPFVKPWLNEYFRAQPWYTPKEKANLAGMTEYDRQNVATITTAEQAFSRTDLVRMRDELDQTHQTLEQRVEFALIGAALGEYAGAADVPVAQRNPLEDPTVLERQLSLAQIEGLSRRDLRLLRNTIYARHGRPFKSEVLQMYFADKAWYAENASFKEAMLSEVDKRNIQLVQSMEDRLGGPMTEWDHQNEEGWFAGA